MKTIERGYEPVLEERAKEVKIDLRAKIDELETRIKCNQISAGAALCLLAGTLLDGFHDAYTRETRERAEKFAKHRSELKRILENDHEMPWEMQRDAGLRVFDEAAK